MVIELQVWVEKSTGKCWTIDNRLKQFRHVFSLEEEPGIEFVDFDSKRGQKMWEKIIK